jgi:uncharacterized protein (DUF1697 family)
MKYVVFHRAINIGSRRIKMADLRRIYVDLGHAGVSSFIASGNIILDSAQVPDSAELQSAFESAFGFSSSAFVRSETEIGSLISANPWLDGEGVVEVSFLESVPDPMQARALEDTAVEPEALLVCGAEVLFLRQGHGVPTMHKESMSMQILGMTMTRRSMSTVRDVHHRFLVDQSEPRLDRADRDEGARA